MNSWGSCWEFALTPFSPHEPYGGAYLIGGIDPFWRTLKGESRTDEAWAEVLKLAPDADLPQRVTDWLAGMTDRYCIRAFEALSVPEAFAL